MTERNITKYVRLNDKCVTGPNDGTNHVKLLSQLTGVDRDVFDAKTFANTQTEGSFDAGFFYEEKDCIGVGGISRSLCFPPEDMPKESLMELKRRTVELMNEKEKTDKYRVDLD